MIGPKTFDNELIQDLSNLSLEESSTHTIETTRLVKEGLENIEKVVHAFLKKIPRLPLSAPQITGVEFMVADCIELRINLLKKDMAKYSVAERYNMNLFYHFEITEVIFKELDNKVYYPYLPGILRSYANLCAVWQQYFSDKDIGKRFAAIQSKCEKTARQQAKRTQRTVPPKSSIPKNKSKNIFQQISEKEQAEEQNTQSEDTAMFILLEAVGYDPQNENDNAAIILNKYLSLVKNDTFFENFKVLYNDYLISHERFLAEQSIDLSNNTTNGACSFPRVNIISFFLQEVLTKTGVSFNNTSRMLFLFWRDITKFFLLNHTGLRKPTTIELEKHKALADLVFQHYYKFLWDNTQKDRSHPEKFIASLKINTMKVCLDNLAIETQYCRASHVLGNLDSYQKSLGFCQSLLAEVIARSELMKQVSGYEQVKTSLQLVKLTSEIDSLSTLSTKEAEVNSLSFRLVTPEEVKTPNITSSSQQPAVFRQIDLPDNVIKVLKKLHSANYWAYATGMYVLNQFLNYPEDNMAFNSVKIVTNCPQIKLSALGISYIEQAQCLILGYDLELISTPLSFKQFTRSVNKIAYKIYCNFDGLFVDPLQVTSHAKKSKHNFVPSLNLQIGNIDLENFLHLLQLIVQIKHPMPAGVIKKMQQKPLLLTSSSFSYYCKNLNAFFLKSQGKNYLLFFKSNSLLSHLLPPAIHNNNCYYEPSDEVMIFNFLSTKFNEIDTNLALRTDITVYHVLALLLLSEIVYRRRNTEVDLNNIIRMTLEDFCNHFESMPDRKKQWVLTKVPACILSYYSEYLFFQIEKEREKENEDHDEKEKEFSSKFPLIPQFDSRRTSSSQSLQILPDTGAEQSIVPSLNL